MELPYSGYNNDDERDLRILYRYASAHWLKFDIIKSRTIISTFLLDEYHKFEAQFKNKRLAAKKIYKAINAQMRVDDIKQQLETIVRNLKRYDFIDFSQIEKNIANK